MRLRRRHLFGASGGVTLADLMPGTTAVYVTHDEQHMYWSAGTSDGGGAVWRFKK